MSRRNGLANGPPPFGNTVYMIILEELYETLEDVYLELFGQDLFKEATVAE